MWLSCPRGSQEFRGTSAGRHRRLRAPCSPRSSSAHSSRGGRAPRRIGARRTRGRRRRDRMPSADGSVRLSVNGEDDHVDLSGVGVWSSQLRYGKPEESAEAAAELEELGFTALWIPDVGGPVFDSVAHLLASTKHTVIATGILNLWMHEPSDVAASYASLTKTHGERFMLGIGVSHAPLVDSREPGRYRKPLAATRAFLDAVDSTEQPVPVENRVLAALGPKMLELSATRARGAHPYLVTPDHTHKAREVLGDGPLLLPEQTVLLTESRDE